MKKLLTTLTLALALCLLCGVALAANIELTGDAYLNATQAIMTSGAVDTINVTYKGNPVALNWMNKLPTLKCLEKRTLHYEGNYFGDTIFFDFLYTEPHHFDDTLDDSNPGVTLVKRRTCTAPAVFTTVCERCGAKVEYNYAGANNAYKKSLHTWETGCLTGNDDIQKITTAPNCEEGGVWEYFCGNPGCNEKDPTKAPQEIAEVGHDFIFEWVEEPTCISKGYVHYFCRHCGIEWNDFLNSGSIAAGKVTNWRKNEAAKILNTKYTIEDAYYESSILWEQSWGDLNWRSAWWINELGWNYKGHDFDAFVPYEEATCAHPSTYIRWCKVCAEKQIVDNITLNGWNDSLPYDYQMISKVRDNDCKKVKVTFRCANCNGATHADIVVNMEDKVKLSNSNPALTWQWDAIGMDRNEVASVEAHEYDTTDATRKIKTFAPTCEGQGFTAYQCVHCGKAAADYLDGAGNLIIPAGGHAVLKTDIKPAKGHDWGEGWVMQYAPGEYDNENGYWLRTCKVCGKTENRISPFYPDACAEHNFVVVDKQDNTCTDDGYIFEICTVCGEVKITDLVAGGHVNELVVKTAPTCTKEGEGIEVCKICGNAVTIAIPALGHDMKAVEKVEPTCTEKGTEAGEKCSRCDYTTGLAEIPAKGHDYQLSAAVEPTCTKEGHSEGMACTVCGDVLVKSSVIPALGHDIVKTEGKAATCTKDGYTASEKCTRCDDATVESEVIKALGHTWDEGKVTKEAAEGVKGEKVFTCTVCGEKKTEEIPALPVPAEYTVDGLDYTNPVATGTAELKEGTDPLAKAYARVTFFLANGDCMIQIVDVDKDGNFTAGAIGNFVHISVVIVDVDDAYGADEAIEHAYGNGGIAL